MKISIIISLLMVSLFNVMAGADTVNDRLDDMLDDYLANPYPDPEGSPPSLRGRAGYAMVALYKGTDLTTANNYINWIQDNYDVPDSTSWGFDSYWMMNLLLRVYLDPTCYSNMTQSAKDDLELMFWRYIRQRSKVSDARASVWRIRESENHDAMRITTFYLAAQALISAGGYNPDTLLVDGYTIRQHHEAWENYWHGYFRQRAREGINCEIASPIYAKYIIACYYNICDLADSGSLARQADYFLTLYWADTASDFLQATGIRGGAETRCYKDAYLMTGRYGFLHLTYAYDWHDTDTTNTHFPDTVISAVSGYRVPEIVTACAAATNKTPFLYTSRRFGKGTHVSGSNGLLYTVNFDTDMASSLRRDTYVAPEYVMGTLSLNQTKDYTLLIDQSRIMGVFCEGNLNDRVVIHGKGTIDSGRTGYTEIHGACSVDCMVVARDTGVNNSDGTRIFVSTNLWNNRVENDGGWLFTYSGDAYIGIRIATGGIVPYYNSPVDVGYGMMLDLQDMWSPVVLQMGQASAYGNSFSAFRDSVKNNSFTYSSGKLTYVSENSKTFEIWRYSNNIPKINGTTVDLNPAKTYDSPYISSYHGSDTVKLMYPGYNDIVLDFDYIDSPMWDDWQTVALWHMDTVPSGKVIDDDLENSLRNRDLTLYGGLTVTSGDGGKFDEALNFDGVDDYGVATSNWPGGSTVKVDLWFKADGITVNPGILATARNTWDVRQELGSISFIIWDSNSVIRSVVVPDIINPGTWQHCSASVDASGNMILKVDDTSVTGSGNPMKQQAVAIDVGTKLGYPRYFDGKIDELKIRTNILLNLVCTIDATSGNLNDDCVVDIRDLGILVNNWLECGLIPPPKYCP